MMLLDLGSLAVGRREHHSREDVMVVMMMGMLMNSMRHVLVSRLVDLVLLRNRSGDHCSCWSTTTEQS